MRVQRASRLSAARLVEALCGATVNAERSRHSRRRRCLTTKSRLCYNGLCLAARREPTAQAGVPI
jgi:hypothetical protein